MDFEIKCCKTKAVYSVKPKKRISLNLNKMKSRFETLVDTPILIVINIDGHEVIVHNHGELKFKDLKDEKMIEKLANLIYGDA